MATTFGWENVYAPGIIGDTQGTNNSSNFTGLAGGFRIIAGTFHIIRLGGYWWTCTEADSSSGLGRVLFNSYDYLEKVAEDKRRGFSVRCLRN